MYINDERENFMKENAAEIKANEKILKHEEID